ncbi:MAG TPA: SRPBCC family protein, partial [Pseudonocardiaceae bacterium]
VDELNRVHREVGTGRTRTGEATAVLLRRDFDASVEDVWDACTDPTRISRWFLPVTGELTLGGHYQLEGNAGGEILRCEAPRLLRVTWEFGELPPSEVEVRLSPAGADRTLFELEHAGIAEPPMWARFGPGAVGVGWDLTVLGLAMHLADATVEKPEEWQRSPEALAFMTASSTAWGAAYEKSGATPEEAASAVANTTAAYTTPPPAE